MTTEIFEGLGTQVENAFFLIGATILLTELAETWFKGALKGHKIMEMAASASTQIPSILFETFVMTAAYAVYYIIAEAFVSWTLPITWWTIALGLFVADFFYYWEHRIAHEVRLLWTQHAVHHSSRDFNSANPIHVWFSELPQLWRDLVAAETIWEAFMRLFARSGWQPSSEDDRSFNHHEDARPSPLGRMALRWNAAEKVQRFHWRNLVAHALRDDADRFRPAVHWFHN